MPWVPDPQCGTGEKGAFSWKSPKKWWIMCPRSPETLDTDGVEPMSHVFPVKNVLRADEVQPSFPREELLKNAPGGDEEAFLVPKAVD